MAISDVVFRTPEYLSWCKHILRKVDLPLPLEPSKPRLCPGYNSSDMFLRIFLPFPYPPETWFAYKRGFFIVAFAISTSPVKLSYVFAFPSSASYADCICLYLSFRLRAKPKLIQQLTQKPQPKRLIIHFLRKHLAVDWQHVGLFFFSASFRPVFYSTTAAIMYYNMLIVMPSNNHNGV